MGLLIFFAPRVSKGTEDLDVPTKAVKGNNTLEKRPPTL
jgi:hypothetical protein